MISGAIETAPPPLRLLVCGGRDYTDEVAVFGVLDAVHAKRGIACIIAGAATGADRVAYTWAKSRSIEIHEFPADWKTHGKAAGPIRNRQMLSEGRPTGVVAFPGGRGTADMIRAAKESGLQVWEPIKHA
jgi:hypothetical protein